MESYRTFLKRVDFNPLCRWVIKRDDKDDIIDVKLIFKPSEYKRGKNAKPMVVQKKLIEILDKYHETKSIKIQ